VNGFQRVISPSILLTHEASRQHLRSLSRVAEGTNASRGLRDLPFALLDEREQIAVDEIRMRGGQTV
jgi:hypothetical protein